MQPLSNIESLLYFTPELLLVVSAIVVILVDLGVKNRESGTVGLPLPCRYRLRIRCSPSHARAARGQNFHLPFSRDDPARCVFYLFQGAAAACNRSNNSFLHPFGRT